MAWRADRSVGCPRQSFQLIAGLDALDNVEVPLRVRGMDARGTSSPCSSNSVASATQAAG
ncbi:hypothetical protein BE21_22825 [Sorangium cellulosum]|uniref:Uncharacterized protein n=1 Tax=Sorangium cellulosum TaxID=56 RepID=A0A150TV56_SORCE|nr:hypothetical protein BE21_22825 [Sorangium cellulosum]